VPCQSSMPAACSPPAKEPGSFAPHSSTRDMAGTGCFHEPSFQNPGNDHYRLSWRGEDDPYSPPAGKCQRRRLALIINEFGDIGIDADILNGCGDLTCGAETIIELANGCICCTVADDFLPAIERLLALDPLPDHIVIETSGLALPKPLVKAFDWRHSRAINVDGVIAVATARRSPMDASPTIQSNWRASARPILPSHMTIHSKKFLRIKCYAPISSAQ